MMPDPALTARVLELASAANAAQDRAERTPRTIKGREFLLAGVAMARDSAKLGYDLDCGERFRYTEDLMGRLFWNTKPEDMDNG